MTILKKSTVNWVGEVNSNIKARCEEAEQEAFDMAIEALQADRLSGEWIYLHGSIGSYMTMSCPFCGETFNDVAEWKYNYCPLCGARMRGGDDRE